MQVWEDQNIKPEILAERREGCSVELDFCPSGDLLQFQGHFPQQAIFPGVGQLDWAVRFAAEKLGIDTPINEVSQLKFRELMTPGVLVTLRLEYQVEKERLVFSYTGEGKNFSSGIIKLGSS